MEKYKNLAGHSGVASFVTGSNSITVTFTDEIVYTYTDRSAGPANVTAMKQLAKNGAGLNTFINKNVRKKYESKTRR